MKESTKSTLRKIGAFFGLCFSVLGCIGGIGYACYNHAYAIAVGVAFLGYCAFPKVKAFVKELTS